jgi:hypothetical protein
MPEWARSARLSLIFDVQVQPPCQVADLAVDCGPHCGSELDVLVHRVDAQHSCPAVGYRIELSD